MASVDVTEVESAADLKRFITLPNKLYKGDLVVGGNTARLSDIRVPIMAAMAEHDHIVAYEASKPLLDLVGSTDKEEIVLKGGHVSLIAGPNAVRRMWPKLAEWLGERSV